MIQKKKKIKERHFSAIAARHRSGAGKHKDHSKYDRKRDKKVSIDE
jgi:hypothetical protein